MSRHWATGRSARGRNLISSLGLLRECLLFRLANLRLGWRIQLANATVWLNISAAFGPPSVFLGLSFSCLANPLSFDCK